MKTKPHALNPDFARFCEEPSEDRDAVFTSVAREMKASAVAIEKDFHVCRTIDAIFHGLATKPKAFFKGGTSLSKGYSLINRFSEDIDIVLSAPGLGFSGARDPANPEITKSMKKKVLSKEDPKALPQKVKHHTRETMREALAELLPDYTITAVDTADEYGAALQIAYDSVLPPDPGIDKYIKRSVLIETGGRSAREPVDAIDITAYIQKALDADEWNLVAPGITVIKPQRTFWDKVYILDRICRSHDEGKLKLDGADRKSRHYLDLSSMYGTEVGDSAIADKDLAERVRAAFPAPDDAVPGKLRLVPPKDVIALLRSDYNAGTARMVFGDAPAFADLVKRIAQLEKAINSQ